MTVLMEFNMTKKYLLSLTLDLIFFVCIYIINIGGDFSFYAELFLLIICYLSVMAGLLGIFLFKDFVNIKSHFGDGFNAYRTIITLVKIILIAKIGWHITAVLYLASWIVIFAARLKSN